MTFQVVDNTTTSYFQGLLCCLCVAEETLFCFPPTHYDDALPDDGSQDDYVFLV